MAREDDLLSRNCGNFFHLDLSPGVVYGIVCLRYHDDQRGEGNLCERAYGSLGKHVGLRLGLCFVAHRVVRSSVAGTNDAELHALPKLQRQHLQHHSR